MFNGLEVGWDRPGPPIATATPSNPIDCRNLCSQRFDCHAFSYVTATNTCYMKSYTPRVTQNEGVTSGLSLSRLPFDLPSGANLPGMPLTGLTDDGCETQCAANASCVAYTFATSNQTCGAPATRRIPGAPQSGIHRPGVDLPGMPVSAANATACQTLCLNHPDCRSFTFTAGSCSLKRDSVAAVSNAAFMSGFIIDPHGIYSGRKGMHTFIH